MAKTRAVVQSINTYFGPKVISGPVPDGLEWFRSTYHGERVEYSVYRDEYFSDNPPIVVHITYLDTNLSEPLQEGLALLSDLDAYAQPSDIFFDVKDFLLP